MKRELPIFLAIFLVIIFSCGGCGRKGPPFVPVMEVTSWVEELQGEIKDGVLVLRGRLSPVPDRDGTVSHFRGCAVYHVRYPQDNPPCEGCPIKFSGYEEIGAEVIKDGKFRCEIPAIKRKGVHFFKVGLIGPKGAVGPLSNRAKLIINDTMLPNG